MPDFVAKQLDAAPTWSDTLSYSNGTNPNLTAASVNFVMRSLTNTAASINAAATIVNTLEGEVSFTPTALQTATAGDFIGSWVVTFSSGVVQTFPTVGYLDIVIEPSIAGSTASRRRLWTSRRLRSTSTSRRPTASTTTSCSASSTAWCQ